MAQVAGGFCLPELGFAVGLAASMASASAAAGQNTNPKPCGSPSMTCRLTPVDSDGSISGVSVDLWRRVAEQMEWPFKLIPVADMEVDSQRPQNYESFRCRHRRHHDHAGTGGACRLLLSGPSFRRRDRAAQADRGDLCADVLLDGCNQMGPLIIVILAMPHLIGIAMWIVEQRDRSTAPGSGPRSSVRRCCWAVVTMTTVGYGNKTPKTMPGRVVAMVWMLSSLVLVSLLSTSLVSRLTAERVESRDLAASIDLRERKLAAVVQSSGAEYLDELHVCNTPNTKIYRKRSSRWQGSNRTR